jgi:hypothetical protein
MNNKQTYHINDYRMRKTSRRMETMLMELWISRFDIWMVIMDVVVGLVVVWIGSYELID